LEVIGESNGRSNYAARRYKKTLRYRVLRYTRNLIRDEWVNIRILLEEFQELEAVGVSRRAIKIIEKDREFARVRKLHPAADVQLLHSLRSDFESLPGMAGDDVRKYFLNFERAWPPLRNSRSAPPPMFAAALLKARVRGYATS
jgi:hypothetical protein